MRVLVTGGAGFIGSTVASACEDSGHEVVVLDDLSTGRVEFTAGRPFVHGDVRDVDALEAAFTRHGEVDAVVHCAAHIVVPESVSDPLRYYDNNVGGMVSLLRAASRFGCGRTVFSSSASIYAPAADLTVDEGSCTAPASPYARSKLVCEHVLEDTCAAAGSRAVSLRYFNPVGADPRLRTGLQLDRPSHALGLLVTAWRERGTFTVTGTHWPTRDGSGIRDYVHVWDLALAHVAALERLDDVVAAGQVLPVNLGTGTGTTVLELVEAFRQVAPGTVDVRLGEPRPGDAAGTYTRSARAREVLGWAARYSLPEAIEHALQWDRVRTERLPCA